MRNHIIIIVGFFCLFFFRNFKGESLFLAVLSIVIIKLWRKTLIWGLSVDTFVLMLAEQIHIMVHLRTTILHRGSVQQIMLHATFLILACLCGFHHCSLRNDMDVFFLSCIEMICIFVCVCISFIRFRYLSFHKLFLWLKGHVARVNM